MSIFDKMDSNFRKEISIIETLIKNIIMNGDITVTEYKLLREEIIRNTLSGNTNKVKKIIEHTQIKEIC